MKQCPVCRTTYTDITLRYCLADGAALTDDAGEATVVRHADPMRIDISSGKQPLPSAPQPAAGGGSVRTWIKVLIAVVLLAALLVVVVAAGVAFYFSQGGNTPASSDRQDLKPRSSPTPTAYDDQADETEELKEQIANLEKLLNEQKQSSQPSDIPLTLPNQPTTTTTAEVNSPGDGFLALRTFPNSQAGSRILEIPHGSIVSVGACLNRSRIAKRAGRWCRASYNGYSGWVFDAFLIY